MPWAFPTRRCSASKVLRIIRRPRRWMRPSPATTIWRWSRSRSRSTACGRAPRGADRRPADPIGTTEPDMTDFLPGPYPTLELERPDPAVLIVRLNRPAAANAMNTQMGPDLMGVFETLQIQQDGLRCVVVTGAGERAFCAGGDLVERRTMTDEQWQAQHAIYERMVRALVNCPLPVIAAVNGAAIGGGCEIAAGCDFVYAPRHARLALPEVT